MIRLIGLLVGRWLVCWMIGGRVVIGWLNGRLVIGRMGLLVGWRLVCWMIGCLFVCLFDGMVGWSVCLCVCGVVRRWVG